MFTVKYVDEKGSENICECAHVVADRTDDHQRRVMIFNEPPSLTGDNNNGIYVESRVGTAGELPRRLYVMNRFGATVATYNL